MCIIVMLFSSEGGGCFVMMNDGEDFDFLDFDFEGSVCGGPLIFQNRKRSKQAKTRKMSIVVNSVGSHKFKGNVVGG